MSGQNMKAKELSKPDKVRKNRNLAFCRFKQLFCMKRRKNEKRFIRAAGRILRCRLCAVTYAGSKKKYTGVCHAKPLCG